jgi:hypothetical protein
VVISVPPRRRSSRCARAAGAIAAVGDQAIALLFEVEHLLSFDPGLQDPRVDAQRVARQDDEIGILARLEGADAAAEIEHFGRGQGDRLEPCPARHAGAHPEGGGAEEQPRIVDEVVGVKRHAPTRLLEGRAAAPVEIARLELAAGAVDQDERARHTRRGDPFGDLRGVAHMMEDDPEAEFVAQPEHGQDVVVAVGVVVDDAPSLEDLDQRLHADVAIRLLLRVVRGRRELVAVLLRLDERLPHQGRRLGPTAGERGIRP